MEYTVERCDRRIRSLQRLLMLWNRRRGHLLLKAHWQRRPEKLPEMDAKTRGRYRYLSRKVGRTAALEILFPAGNPSSPRPPADRRTITPGADGARSVGLSHPAERARHSDRAVGEADD